EREEPAPLGRRPARAAQGPRPARRARPQPVGRERHPARRCGDGRVDRHRGDHHLRHRPDAEV
ncbi:MAG: hypothetical protein AVDCRST_MAG48-1728, partial [uncultured Friedmanniella sp.]